MPWLPWTPTTSPPRHQGGTAASVLTHEPGVLLCPLRCPPVSSSMSSCVFICSPSMSSYVSLLCHPLYPPMHSKMFFCVFLDCDCDTGPVSPCVPVSSRAFFLFLHMFPSCVFLFPLVSPAVSPLNVLLCLLAIILSSLVPSFMLLFCVHVFIKLFKSSIFHTNMFILCPHLTHIFYSVK